MLKFIRMLFKIVLSPFILLLSFAIFIVDKIFGLIAGISMILSVITCIYGIYCFFTPAYNWAITSAFICTFLFSPFGIPLFGTILIVSAETFRDWLKAI